MKRFVAKTVFLTRKFMISLAIYMIFMIFLYIYSSYFLHKLPSEARLFILSYLSYNLWFYISLISSALASVTISEDLEEKAHYIFLKSIYRNSFRNYVWNKVMIELTFLTILSIISSLILFITISSPVEKFTVDDYERLSILLLLLSTIPITSTIAFSSFIPDQKSALLFSVTLYFFGNVLIDYYLQKYAPHLMLYVLFTLPYYFPTAFHNWREIYFQTKIVYYGLYGTNLPYVKYCTILEVLILYAIVSAISMVVGIEFNLRKRIKD
ncbi:hypothetical protein D1867_07635 [Acidianus infernus]|uniref:Uncharacterized protein n=1 Tax=Acidianus infernus TaxID=12915 RepID=A0A6A9QH11_ACIIN|nr:hypothetical protein [Acidianus infernus]MUM65103.1 hypothetical protein [Acidianus infernus]